MKTEQAVYYQTVNGAATKGTCQDSVGADRKLREMQRNLPEAIEWEHH